MAGFSKNDWMKHVKMGLLDVEICDVTLRDGEQTPGVSFTKEEKMEIARTLDEIGVEVIEAGFPVVSQGEKDAVKAIARMGLDAKICCLARAVKEDVDAVLDCDADIVGIFMGTSELHLKYKHKKTQEEAIDCMVTALEHAKRHGLVVRFAAEDSTRTDLEFLKRFYKAGEEAGADYVSIADTVGAMNPTTMKYLVSEIRKAVSIPVCVHCHDDLGLAVANTLAAAEAGARQLHTTVNGIGERAGNAALEEVLMGLLIHYNVDRYDTTRLKGLSDMVARYSGIAVAKNKAVVGANAFAHESGIHIAALLENDRTYELYSPELVGGSREFILGKHSGSKALCYMARQMGYTLSQAETSLILEEIKRLSDMKKSLRKEELAELISRTLAEEKLSMTKT
ncbi:homocitrate synthase family protein [Methanocella conradii]|uniref:homocitrate synthase family protein n=1 Tax=Methanocella conradii TaxID=1175444 RepID=UPI0024B3266C|nr:homocitrate synthase family protein [Methanocella conradii]MDI6895879.1 homocitrate synthase family protein [Methanocella conradii]